MCFLVIATTSLILVEERCSVSLLSREKPSFIWLLRVFPSGRRSIHHLLVAVVGSEFRDPLPEL